MAFFAVNATTEIVANGDVVHENVISHLIGAVSTVGDVNPGDAANPTAPADNVGANGAKPDVNPGTDDSPKVVNCGANPGAADDSTVISDNESVDESTDVSTMPAVNGDTKPVNPADVSTEAVIPVGAADVSTGPGANGDAKPGAADVSTGPGANGDAKPGAWSCAVSEYDGPGFGNGNATATKADNPVDTKLGESTNESTGIRLGAAKPSAQLSTAVNPVASVATKTVKPVDAVDSKRDGSTDETGSTRMGAVKPSTNPNDVGYKADAVAKQLATAAKAKEIGLKLIAEGDAQEAAKKLKIKLVEEATAKQRQTVADAKEAQNIATKATACRSALEDEDKKAKENREAAVKAAEDATDAQRSGEADTDGFTTVRKPAVDKVVDNVMAAGVAVDTKTSSGESKMVATGVSDVPPPGTSVKTENSFLITLMEDLRRELGNLNCCISGKKSKFNVTGDLHLHGNLQQQNELKAADDIVTQLQKNFSSDDKFSWIDTESYDPSNANIRKNFFTISILLHGNLLRGNSLYFGVSFHAFNKSANAPQTNLTFLIKAANQTLNKIWIPSDQSLYRVSYTSYPHRTPYTGLTSVGQLIDIMKSFLVTTDGKPLVSVASAASAALPRVSFNASLTQEEDFPLLATVNAQNMARVVWGGISTPIQAPQPFLVRNTLIDVTSLKKQQEEAAFKQKTTDIKAMCAANISNLTLEHRKKIEAITQAFNAQRAEMEKAFKAQHAELEKQMKNDIDAASKASSDIASKQPD